MGPQRNELTQKWRNAISMASPVQLQWISTQVKRTFPKPYTEQRQRTKVAMDGRATNTWLQAAFTYCHAYGVFKDSTTIQKSNSFFFSLFTVCLPLWITRCESLVYFAHHHSITSENDAWNNNQHSKDIWWVSEWTRLTIAKKTHYLPQL